MGVVGYTIVSPQGRAAEQRAVQIVTKLMARKKQLEQLKPATAQV
jgi:tryptophanase